MRGCTSISVLALLFVVACSSDDSSEEPVQREEICMGSQCPSSNEGWSTEQIVAPTAPTAPASAVLPQEAQLIDWTCPTGWESVPTDEGFSVCRPPPWPSECAPGTMAVLGERECVQQGPVCPTGEAWADEESIRQRAPGFEGRVIYVQAGANGRSGTRENPMGTIVQAVESADEADIIAVGVGTYTDPVDMPGNVALIGACVEQTILDTNDESLFRGSIIVRNEGSVLISGLTISGPRRGVSISSPLVETTLRAVRIEGAAQAGVWAQDSTGVTLEDLVVVETEVHTSGQQGFGIIALDSEVTVRRALIARNHEQGVSLTGPGTSFVAEDMIVEDTQQIAQTFGFGIVIGNSSRIELSRCVIARNRSAALYAEGEDTSLTLEDVHLVETSVETAGGGGGQGLRINQAQLNASRVIIEGNHTTGILLREGAQVTLQDALIADGQPQPSNGRGGWGATVYSGSNLTLSRALITRNQGAGIVVESASTATLTDTIIRDTGAHDALAEEGRGLSVILAHLELSRVTVAHNHSIGVILSMSTATIEDLIVRDTQAQPSTEEFGRGLTIKTGSNVQVSRALLERNHEFGVHVHTSSTAKLEDITVTDTLRPVNPDEPHAVGLYVEDDAGLELHRGNFARNNGMGILLAGTGSRLLEDVTVTDTQPDAVFDIAGWGIAIDDSASVRVLRAHLDGNHGLGLVTVPTENPHVDVVHLEDIAVSNTQPGPLNLGIGIAAFAGLELFRSTISHNRWSGLHMGDNPTGRTVRIEDVRITDTQSQAGLQIDRGHGRGIQVINGVLEIDRVVLDTNYEIGLHATAKATVTARNLVIQNTLLSACAPSCNYTDLPEATFGAGIMVFGASLDIDGFEIIGNAIAGIQLVEPETVSIRHGLIRDNPIGINLHNTELVLEETFIDVSLSDNALDIGTTTLPVPTAAGLLDRLREEHR